MSLTCECPDYEADAGSTVWYEPRDFTTYDRARSTRCASCGDRIRPGDDCARFDRVKLASHDIEVAIYGDGGEIPRAPHWHCYRCAGIFFSLVDLDYCPTPTDDMRDLAREYADQHRSPAA